jgi:hypothetical protein
MTKIFQHRWPVWNDEADTSIFVHTQPDDLYGEEYELEEIPAQVLGEDLYKVCAIPLLVHNINLGDVVKADAARTYQETVTDSGRFGFRLAVNISDSHDDEPAEFTSVINNLQKKNWNIEFFSHVLVGVDADNLKKAKKLSSELEKMVKKKWLIAYDTVRS